MAPYIPVTFALHSGKPLRECRDLLTVVRVRRDGDSNNRCPQAGRDPVYFEANLVNPTYFYPYGYSPILTVRFGS